MVRMDRFGHLTPPRPVPALAFLRLSGESALTRQLRMSPRTTWLVVLNLSRGRQTSQSRRVVYWIFSYVDSWYRLKDCRF